MDRRRRTLVVALGAAPFGAATAQSSTGKTVKIVVPFPPGQGADLIIRMLADQLPTRLNQSVIVENRPGAGGLLGMSAVAKAPADGLTLVMGGSGPVSIAPTLQASVAKYDPVKDFEPVSGVATVAQLFVVPVESPLRSVRDVIAAARAQPGKVAYGSSGNGTTQHLFVEYFASMAGIKLLHVPYKGSAPALTDLLGGQIQFMSDTVAAMVPHVKSGKLRALGVTSPARSPFLPDVPTVAEQGLGGYEAVGWVTVLAPAGAPAEVLDRQAQAIQAILTEPAIREKLAGMGFVPMSQTRESLRVFIGTELAKWRKVIETAQIKVE
jgi:tripartite-type tricarboxylate transporter receptor subunit TctC